MTKKLIYLFVFFSIPAFSGNASAFADGGAVVEVFL